MATFMEPVPQNPPNYHGENMLIGANRLNKDIKRFIENTYGTYDMYEDDLDVLQEFDNDIDKYLHDISPYNFAPRTDRLTKEGILVDLRENSQLIAQLIDETNQRIVNSFNTQRGGKKKKSKIRKIGSRKMKRTRKIRKGRRTNKRTHYKLRK
jgi:hypothetical protein